MKNCEMKSPLNDRIRSDQQQWFWVGEDKLAVLRKAAFALFARYHSRVAARNFVRSMLDV